MFARLIWAYLEWAWKCRVPRKVKYLIPFTSGLESTEELRKGLPWLWKFSHEVTIGSSRRAVCEAPLNGSMTKEELENRLREALNASRIARGKFPPEKPI